MRLLRAVSEDDMAARRARGGARPHRPAPQVSRTDTPIVAGRSPAHGFCDDEQTRRLLRSRPPRQALAWAGACLGGPVASARALRGGMSSAVHLVTARRPSGEREQAVLRRY